MKLFTPIRSIVDRAWFRVDWSGGQTLTHRAVAAGPLLAVALLCLLPLPGALQLGLLVIGVVSSVGLTMWIEYRRMVGTGAFSTRRSERFVRRTKRKRGEPSSGE